MELKDFLTVVPGKKVGDICLFALSTCGWCRKTKDFLNSLGVEYRYVDVDLAEGEARTVVAKEFEKWNPGQSFPTIVINNEKCIIGFDVDGIKEALKIGKN